MTAEDIVVKAVQAYHPIEGAVLFIELDDTHSSDALTRFGEVLKKAIPELRDVVFLNRARVASPPEHVS